MAPYIHMVIKIPTFRNSNDIPKIHAYPMFQTRLNHREEIDGIKEIFPRLVTAFSCHVLLIW